MLFFVYEYSEKGEAGGKEFFVGFTIVFAELCSFAAAFPAHKGHLTALAAFGDNKTFLYEIFSRFGFFHCKKIRFFYVPEEIFIGAVKVAGVNTAV